MLAALLVALAATGVSGARPASATTNDGSVFHDPSVIKVGGCYYAFSTGFEQDANNPTGSVTEAKSCTSPVGPWTKVGNTWSTTPSWITQKLGKTPPNIWAPDIKYFNNRYHLYYGASVWGTSDAVLGLLTATTIEGPWTDQGMVTDVNYPIDPQVDWGPDGRLYVTWGSFSKGVWMHVLDKTTGKLSTTDNDLWHLAESIEGATIVLNGGYYYLFGSTGTCCSGSNSNYWTVVGRSTSITGPYVDQNGKAMTDSGSTFVLKGANPRNSAGGADAFDDGSDTYLAYHYYDTADSGTSRLDVRKLSFTNGWPTMSAPLNKTNLVLANRNSYQCVDVWYASTSDGAAVDQGNCNGGTNQQWKLTPVGSSYELVNAGSGKCLEMSAWATADGTAATQYTCNAGANQQWTQTPVIGGYVRYTNVNSGKCLDVTGSSQTNGAALVQSACSSSLSQLWLVD